MYTFLIVALILFGIGCCIGAAYGIIRYGIPTIVGGTVGMFQAVAQGWREGDREFKEKYGRK